MDKITQVLIINGTLTEQAELLYRKINHTFFIPLRLANK